MKNNDTTFLQKLMDEMDSDQLNEMLQDELQKETPDGNAVRVAMRVLESREKFHLSGLSEDTAEAWKGYQAKSKELQTVPTKKYSAVLKAASVILILGILFFAIPQTVQASGLFGRIVQWTDSFLELLTTKNPPIGYSEYVFETDNPGLQQVYNAVVELGVTDPVVPMWLPGEYEVANCEVDKKVGWACVIAVFTNGEDRAVLQIRINSKNTYSAYFKDDSNVELYEVDGTEYRIMRNDDCWVVLWIPDNVECFITLDCQEEELYRILKSINNSGG